MVKFLHNLPIKPITICPYYRGVIRRIEEGVKQELIGSGKNKKEQSIVELENLREPSQKHKLINEKAGGGILLPHIIDQIRAAQSAQAVRNGGFYIRDRRA